MVEMKHTPNHEHHHLGPAAGGIQCKVPQCLVYELAVVVVPSRMGSGYSVETIGEIRARYEELNRTEYIHTVHIVGWDYIRLRNASERKTRSY